MKRVVITGMGIVSPVGNDLNSYWSNLKAGRHGIAPITHYDTAGLPVKLAAEVKNFDPLLALQPKEVRHTDLYTQYALEASRQAMADCGTDFSDCDPYRLGVYIGTGIGGLNTLESDILLLHEKGSRRISPFSVPKLISNMAAGEAAMRYGFRGCCLSMSAACATSANTIGEAFLAIRDGRLDACLAGGAEACITPYGTSSFSSMHALTSSTDPDRASIPFDRERDGFVLGEGSGVLVLEELNHALKRDAKIYAEVVGYGVTSDAYHITAPRPTGEAAAKAMSLACEMAGISTDEVDYVNAHGTSTPMNDRCETKAIKLAFGSHAKDLLISSTKSMTGHLLGGAGAVEAIACAMALKEGFVPMTANFRVPDEKCDLNYVTEHGLERKLNFVLSNSCGFGGHNAVLCLKRF